MPIPGRVIGNSNGKGSLNPKLSNERMNKTGIYS